MRFPATNVARRFKATLLCSRRWGLYLFWGASSFVATGRSAADHNVSLTISDTSGSSWTLDLSSFLSVNPDTGAISFLPAGSPLTGNWTWTSVNVLDPVSGNFMPESGVAWHTDQQAAPGVWDSTISFYSTGNQDPFLSYGFTARNNSSMTQTYTFSYGENISPPVSGPYSIYSDIAGSLTPGTVNPSQIAPVSGLTIQKLSFSGDGGATLFNAGVDVGPSFQNSGSGSANYGTFSATGAGTTSGIDYWQFDTQFALTPGRDAVALSGFAELDAIPEASTYALLTGLCALGYAALRRRPSA